MKKTAVRSIVIAVLVFGVLIGAEGRGQRGPAPGLPDLTVSMGKGSVSGTLEVGQSISVKPTVTNNGSISVSRYRIVIYFSNHSLMSPQDISVLGSPGSREVDQIEVAAALDPGASIQLSAKLFHIPDDFSWGDYFITVIVDPGKKIAESDENNNKAEVQLFVKADIDYIDQSNELGFCCHGKGFGTWKSGLAIHFGPFSFPADPAQWKNTEVHYKPQCGIIPPAPAYEQGLYLGSKAIARTVMRSWGITFTKCVPEQGAAGTSFTLQGAYCAGASQGSKKLELRKSPNQFVAEVSVTSWSNNMIAGVIPAVPPGNYYFVITSGGNLLSFYPYVEHFTVI